MSKKLLKQDIYKILSRAASPFWGRYRGHHNLIQWEIVEKDIYKAIDTRYPNKPVEPTTTECGFECHWTEKYGFVPEAGCPIHDK